MGAASSKVSVGFSIIIILKKNIDLQFSKVQLHDCQIKSYVFGQYSLFS